MEESKKIVIDDFDNKVTFNINLFDAEKGLDFVDNLRKNFSGGSASIKPLLDELLPLVDLMDANGEKVVKEGLTRRDCYGIFRNPLSVIELGTEVFEFQMVFLRNSKAFRPLADTLQNMFGFLTLGSETK